MLSKPSVPRLPRLPRPRLTYANLTSTVALVLALGTGTAYAANTITSADIVDGEVKNADLAINAVHTGKIFNGGVWPQDVKPESLTGAQIATDAIGPFELRPNSVDSDEVSNNSLTQDDLATSSVGADEVANSSLTGADIANDSLTFFDLTGGGGNGTVNVAAGTVPNGRCKEVYVKIAGATAGDAVVFSVRGNMPDGVFFYGTRVTSSSNLVAVLCNLSGGAMPAINNVPVRILTFH